MKERSDPNSAKRSHESNNSEGRRDDLRFVSNLESVGRRLNVPYRIVVDWRDRDGCPFLKNHPYDIEAIKLWLTKRAEIEIDPNSAMSLKKLQAEVKTLEQKNVLFSRDKTFWLAVAVLGIAIPREIREWLKGENDTPAQSRKYDAGNSEIRFSDFVDYIKNQGVVIEYTSHSHCLWKNINGDVIAARNDPGAILPNDFIAEVCRVLRIPIPHLL
jgi:hypothetical protein